MATTVSFSVRIDRDIKKQCEDLYNELGVSDSLDCPKNC